MAGSFGVPHEHQFQQGTSYNPLAMHHASQRSISPPQMSSSLLESTSSHIIALSPQSLPPNRIKLSLIIGEKVNNMVHELPSMFNDQRHGLMMPTYSPATNASPLQRGLFEALLNPMRAGDGAFRGLIGLIMFVLGIVGWRTFSSNR